MTHAPRIVVLGGGYAGLRVALLLSCLKRRDECEVTLVDKSDAHVNPAVLYEIATAFNPFEREAVGTVLRETASVPFSRIFHGSGVSFLQKAVEHVDPVSRTVRFANDETLSGDFLVLAIGCQLATFRTPGVETHAFSIKSLPEAAELRYHLVRQFLKHRSASRERSERAFRVAVVGGGSAGVELAAELVLFLRKLARLHGVDERRCEVQLFEASEEILREYPPHLRADGLARLKALRVRVRTRQAVCGVGADHLACSDDVFIPADTVVWLAGIRTHDLLLRSGLPVHPCGGVFVERTLEVSLTANVFAAGDCVYAEDPETGKVVPDVLYAAVQQGTVVAQNIVRRLRGKPLLSYVDRPRPTYATVGGKYALVHIPPLQFSGRLGWWLKQLSDLKHLFSILPNDVAFRVWLRSVRVRVAND